MAPAAHRLRSARIARDPGAPLTIATIVTVFAGDSVRNLLGWGGFLIVTALLLVAIWRAAEPRGFLRLLPPSLVLFLGWSTISLLWSAYPFETALGLAAQWATAAAALVLATGVPRRQLWARLATAIRSLLLGSLLFEYAVALWAPDGLAPLSSTGAGEVGLWSMAQLFDGGPIQGLVANRNLLGFLAALGLALALGGVARGALRAGDAALAVATIVLTQSATIALAVAALLMTVAILRLLRRLDHRRRLAAVPALIAAAASLGMLAISGAPVVATVLGRSGDMTGRTDIWEAVVGLTLERPVTGWGWISYWAPWVEPYNNLIVVDGIEYLQAHNALLDVAMQLGLVGAGLALAVAITAMSRSARGALNDPVARTSLLLLVALLVQSLSESRLLVEGNWWLLCVLLMPMSHAARRMRGSDRIAAEVRRRRYAR